MGKNGKTTPVNEARDSIRAGIFSSKKFRSKIINLFGQEVEIRQPSVGQVLSSRDTDDQKLMFITLLCQYAYVPGTDDRVFEDADVEAIEEWPIGPWFKEFNDAIVDLTEIDISAAEKNSRKTLDAAQ